MITRELIERINYLSRKQRTVGLSEGEKQEQHEVRQQYLRGIREQLRQTLDSITVVDKLPDSGAACSCPACETHNYPPRKPN